MNWPWLFAFAAASAIASAMLQPLASTTSGMLVSQLSMTTVGETSAHPWPDPSWRRRG